VAIPFSGVAYLFSVRYLFNADYGNRLATHEFTQVDYLSNNAAVHGLGGGGGGGASPPPTPPDLVLPSLGKARGSAQFGDPLRALAAIGRVANLGRGGAAGMRGGEVHAPEAVVQAVRVMRAERDELRRRDEQRRAGEDKAQHKQREAKHMQKELEVLTDDHTILSTLFCLSVACLYVCLPTKFFAFGTALQYHG
jgi:hypothetical protein